jgi:hypothetical protein
MSERENRYFLHVREREQVFSTCQRERTGIFYMSERENRYFLHVREREQVFSTSERERTGIFYMSERENRYFLHVRVREREQVFSTCPCQREREREQGVYLASSQSIGGPMSQA